MSLDRSFDSKTVRATERAGCVFEKPTKDALWTKVLLAAAEADRVTGLNVFKAYATNH